MICGPSSAESARRTFSQRRRVGRLLTTLCCAGGLYVGASDGVAAQPSEYALKAVYLVHLVNFTEWPGDAFESPEAPLRICVTDPDPFGTVLDDVVAGEQVGGRRLAVTRLAGATPIDGCHVLFVSATARAESLLAAVAHRPILTVGESDVFSRSGGMIRFVLENRRVRFDANVGSARVARLTLSARLLQVARSRTAEK